MRCLAVTPVRVASHSGSTSNTRGAGVLDHVADLFGSEPVVDGHQDPAVRAHPEEGDLEAGRVRADDGHPLAHADAELIEAQGQAPSPGVKLREGESPQRARNSGLVDNRRPVPVGGDGPIKKVADCERHEHWQSPMESVFAPQGSRPGRTGPGARRRESAEANLVSRA